MGLQTHTHTRPLVFGIFWVFFVPPPPCPNQTHAVVKGMVMIHRQAVGSYSGNISWEETLEQSCWLDKCIRKGKRKGFKVKNKFSPSVLNSQELWLNLGATALFQIMMEPKNLISNNVVWDINLGKAE